MRSEFTLRWGTFCLRISFGFLALMTLMFLFDTGSNVLMSAAAILVHELAHIAALLLLGGSMKGLTLSLCEFRISCLDESLGRGARLLVALSGPGANLLLGVLLLGTARQLALVNLTMGAFQLLPIATMDGDNVLELLRVPVALRKVISFLLCFLVALGGFAILLGTRYNFTVLAVSLYLIFLSLRLQ